MTKKHATLNASGAATWANCAGSRKAQEGLPRKSSTFADEGSAVHELGEICLTRNESPFDWIGKPLIEWHEWTVTQEMAEAVQTYIDFVKQFKGERMVEVQVDFSDWVPGGFGTSDCIIIDSNIMTVADFKYGRGKQVYAENNLQGVLYALGAYAMFGDLFDIQTVIISIVQPRMDHIDEWQISVTELLKIGAWLAERAEEAMRDDAPRTPGESQCQWCGAAATCPALKKVADDTVLALFDDEATPDKLTDAQLATALGNAKLITAWLSAVEKHVKERLETGQGFPGYKLVAGRSSRDWSEDESVVVERLLEGFDNVQREQLYETKFVSPAKVEKLIGAKNKGKIADLIATSSGSPTMVPESDKRPALNVTIDEFETLS